MNFAYVRVRDRKSNLNKKTLFVPVKSISNFHPRNINDFLPNHAYRVDRPQGQKMIQLRVTVIAMGSMYSTQF